MQTMELAGSGRTVGRVVFGAMTFGAQVDRDDAAAMVRECRDAGITMFDTSNNYAGGASEEILGEIVRPFRDDVLISTKAGSHVDQADPALSGLKPRALRAAVEASLQRLGTDRVDVFYLHRPDRDTPIEETLGALAELVQEGKILQLGQSNFAAWQITEMAHVAAANGWPPVLLSQPMYNLLGRRVEAEYAECSRHLGLTDITYNPLAGGLLTGKHRADGAPQDGTRFADKPLYRDRYWNPGQFRAVERLREVADGAGLTLIELSYRWVLGSDFADGMLLGASGLEQLRSNLAALEGPPLTPDVLAACDDVWVDLAGAAPAYNR